MLKTYWYINRKCKIFNVSSNTVKASLDVSHPFWILEGILKTVCLMNKPFPYATTIIKLDKYG